PPDTAAPRRKGHPPWPRAPRLHLPQCPRRPAKGVRPATHRLRRPPRLDGNVELKAAVRQELREGGSNDTTKGPHPSAFILPASSLNLHPSALLQLHPHALRLRVVVQGV